MEISDPVAIRALAHPLRLDLLQVLGAAGPSTAAQCGRVLGVSQASCSFHLRQLAKYDFVEEAGTSGDRRERRWRVTDRRLSVKTGSARDATLRQHLERLVVEREMQAVLDYSQRPEGASAEWEHKAGIVSAVVVLSPDEAATLKEKWLELLAPYADAAQHRAMGPEQRYVRCFTAMTPLVWGATDLREDTDHG
ncbi:MAG: helix-turn-helix domain-containing protein [Actinomycetota bacterium]|nr:helix-turn-helix domain-containing protein [Actinomycetota bacterium]MDA8359788.1 helix-turn-helix domain-containing protein [Actinomycetota bacterium]